MILEWAKLADWLKLKPSIILAIVISASFAILSPDWLLAKLGVDSLVRDHRGWFGAALVGSVTLLIARALGWLFGNNRSPLVEWWQKRRLRSVFDTLSPSEKTILKRYLDEQTTSLYFEISDGVVNGLQVKRILYRSSNVSARFTTFPFNLQPWAWDYLQLNRHLVE